jgi:hypothetical protein
MVFDCMIFFRQPKIADVRKLYARASKVNSARQMKVLERWKEFAEDPWMQAILRDEETFSLSQSLFGNLFPDIHLL